MGYELLWKERGVIKKYHGTVTNRDLMQSVIESESDMRFDSLRWVINDFLEISAYDASPAVVEDIVVIDKGASFTNPHIRIAVVATLPAIIEMARQYAESPLNAYPTRIFGAMPEALAWLELAG